MPDKAHVSIFMDNDLTHITDDHFKIKLIARLLNQIYIVQPPMLPPRYDDAPPDEYEYSQPPTSTDGMQDHQHLSSQNIYIHFLPIHRYKVWLHDQEFIMKMCYDDSCIMIYYLIIYCEQILNVHVQDMLLKY